MPFGKTSDNNDEINKHTYDHWTNEHCCTGILKCIEVPPRLVVIHIHKASDDGIKAEMIKHITTHLLDILH